MNVTHNNTEAVRFCAIVLCGPNSDDRARLSDLLDSLFFYEPSILRVIVVDDALEEGAIETEHFNAFRDRIVVLKNPNSRREPDTLSLNVLMALSYTYRLLPVEFVMKFDTDALVINPFSGKLAKRLRDNTEIGMLGLLGDTCDRRRRHFRAHDDLAAIMREASVVREQALDDTTLAKWLSNWRVSRRSTTTTGFRKFCDRFAGLGSTFNGEHCNGGAYAVSAVLLRRLSEMNTLDDGHLWSEFAFPEDRMMGLYCALAGLKAVDFSNVSEPFGIKAAGIAFSPNELAKRGFSIIHSTKEDEQYDEDTIRNFFLGKRQASARLST